MNISEGFIRQSDCDEPPFMAAITCSAGGLSLAARERPAERRLSDAARDRQPAGREPGDDGRLGRHPATRTSSR